jgi:hypothetical protein
MIVQPPTQTLPTRKKEYCPIILIGISTTSKLKDQPIDSELNNNGNTKNLSCLIAGLISLPINLAHASQNVIFFTENLITVTQLRH